MFTYGAISLPDDAVTKRFITDIDFMVCYDAFSYIVWPLDPKGGRS